jgi:hypothetical protein
LHVFPVDPRVYNLAAHSIKLWTVPTGFLSYTHSKSDAAFGLAYFFDNSENPSPPQKTNIRHLADIGSEIETQTVGASIAAGATPARQEDARRPQLKLMV